MRIVAAPSLERVCYEFLGIMTFKATSFIYFKTSLPSNKGSTPRNKEGCKGICFRWIKRKWCLRSVSASRHSIKTWRTVCLDTSHLKVTRLTLRSNICTTALPLLIKERNLSLIRLASASVVLSGPSPQRCCAEPCARVPPSWPPRRRKGGPRWPFGWHLQGSKSDCKIKLSTVKFCTVQFCQFH